MKLKFSRVKLTVTLRAVAKAPQWNAVTALADLCRASTALSEAGIHHWITYGALLGLIRDGELIKWDTDVDIAVGPDVNFAAVENALTAAGMPITKTRSADGRVNVAKFLCGNTAGDIFMTQEIGKKLVTHEGKSPHVFVFSHLYAGSEMREFNGFKVPVPKNAETYLAHIYGPNWRVPAKLWSWKYSAFNLEAVHCIGLRGVYSWGVGWMKWQIKRVCKSIKANASRLAAHAPSTSA